MKSKGRRVSGSALLVIEAVIGGFVWGGVGTVFLFGSFSLLSRRANEFI